MKLNYFFFFSVDFFIFDNFNNYSQVVILLIGLYMLFMEYICQEEDVCVVVEIVVVFNVVIIKSFLDLLCVGLVLFENVFVGEFVVEVFFLRQLGL